MPTGHRVLAERVVAARPADVWMVLTDIERLPAVVSSLESVERLDERGYHRDARWRETRMVRGKLEQGEVRVIFSDPPRRTVIETVTETRRYQVECTLIEMGDRVRLTIEFQAMLDGATGWRRVWRTVLGALTAKPTRQLLERDLREFAEAAEARAAR